MFYTEKQKQRKKRKRRNPRQYTKNLDTNKVGNMKYNNPKPNDFQFTKT